MAYKFTTAKRVSQPDTLISKKSDEAIDRAEKASIKRPIRTKKINLETFHALSDAKKWKKLNSLINAGQGPLRLWKQEVEVEVEVEVEKKVNGKKEVESKRVIYLRPRTWGQYFYETLFLFPAEREARCDKVRAAIQMYIRPHLDAQTSMTAVVSTDKQREISTTLLNSERLAMLDRLESRVYAERIDSNLFSNKPKHVADKTKGDYLFFQDVRTPYHGMTTVPKGLSIAKIAPFKVTADVRILTKATHILANNSWPPGENVSPGEEWTFQKKGKRGKKDSLEEYYAGMLNAFGQHARTIVLEVADDNDDHWHSAYDAACHWLAKCRSNSKPSIMLVPLYRVGEFVPSERNKAHKQGWPKLMAAKLGMNDVKIPNQVSSSPSPISSRNTNGRASTSSLAYQGLSIINDNDNDKDNDGYIIIN